MFLGATELVGMRADYAETLRRTCTIPGTSTVTNAGDGTWDETPSAGTEDVKCSFMATLGNERLVGGSIAQIGNYILRFEVGISLSPKMTIVFDATEDEPARTFQLVAPLDEPGQVGQRWLATEG